MIKWIKNSKSAKTNKSSQYRGITVIKGKYQASILIAKYNNLGKRKQIKYVIGQYDTEIEAMNKRVEFILELL